MDYIAVRQNEGDTPVELPAEKDNTLLLTTLEASFPQACGLVYRLEGNDALHSVRLIDEKFLEPEEGWAQQFQVQTRTDKEKKTEESKGLQSQATTDLIVLGLAWRTTEDKVREYFQNFGTVEMVCVKKNAQTGQSRGFGFVRFAEPSVQSDVIGHRHLIDGRMCEVKIPHSKSADASQSKKIFVGELNSEIGQEDIKEYFSEHGDVSDVFVPQPFRNIAFVTFVDQLTAQTVCSKPSHFIKGFPVRVSMAKPSTRSESSTNSNGQPRTALKRRFSETMDNYDGNKSYFNTSGDWNGEQSSNSLLWDETNWSTGLFTGYTTIDY